MSSVNPLERLCSITRSARPGVPAHPPVTGTNHMTSVSVQRMVRRMCFIIQKAPSGLPVAHTVSCCTDADSRVVASINIVGAVPHQNGSFLRHLQLFHYMQQHSGVRLQAKAVVAADDILEMVATESLQNHRGVLNRFVSGHGLAFLPEMDECRFDAGIIGRTIQAMGQIVPAKDAQRLFETHAMIFAHSQAQQLLDPVPHKTKNFFQRSLRKPHLLKREVHRFCNVPLGLDERPVQIEDKQINRDLCHHFAFRSSSCNVASAARFAESLSFSQASRTKFTMRLCPTWGGRIGSTIFHRFLMAFTRKRNSSVLGSDTKLAVSK